MVNAPDKPEYVATVYGANAYGNPIFRVVSDGLQVCYVTIPYRRSSAEQVDQTITRTLLARRRKPKPVR